MERLSEKRHPADQRNSRPGRRIEVRILRRDKGCNHRATRDAPNQHEIRSAICGYERLLCYRDVKPPRRALYQWRRPATFCLRVQPDEGRLQGGILRRTVRLVREWRERGRRALLGEPRLEWLQRVCTPAENRRMVH